MNRFKKRTGKARDPETWSIGQIIQLGEESPDSWSKDQPRDELEELGEGSPVKVKGYLIHGDTTKTPESCNCYLSGPANNDIHTNLVAKKSAHLGDSIVSEITPHFRPVGRSVDKMGGSDDGRTNVGIYNGGSVTALATAELRRACDGSVLESRSGFIPPNSIVQLNGFSDVFDGCSAFRTAPYETYIVVTVNQPSFSYAVTLSNKRPPWIPVSSSH